MIIPKTTVILFFFPLLFAMLYTADRFNLFESMESPSENKSVLKMITNVAALTPDSMINNPQSISYHFKNRQHSSEKKVYAPLNVEENHQNNSNVMANQQISQKANKQLQNGIELLNKARVQGTLDKTIQTQLNELVRTMDEETNLRFWEQLIADLKAGKYQIS